MSPKNIAGVGLCTRVSAGCFWFKMRLLDHHSKTVSVHQHSTVQRNQSLIVDTNYKSISNS